MSRLDPLPLPIAAQWRIGKGDLYESLYPATGEIIARLHAANEAIENPIGWGK